MWHAEGRLEMYAGLQLGNLEERDHLEDLGIAGRIKLTSVLMKWSEKAYTGFI
jgi:hypothetical protein